MSDDRPTTSSIGRFLKLGGLMSKVSASVATERAIDFAMSSPTKQIRRAENLVKNAGRIVETLGEMKGAAMKVGQMLSLHEGLLPPEVAEVLRALQKEAPQVPPEVMRYEAEGSLGGKIENHFAEFEQEAYASASIGQVHRGRLHDGRRVAIKIQYPLIDEIVRADLKNLKRLLKTLFSMFSEIEFEPVWGELRDRLLEELDYAHEADNMRRMTALHADVPEIVIPKVVQELSTDRVLTMELVEGIPPSVACSERYPQELKNNWGQVLYEFQLRGMFEHRLLHADPNFANFAFLEDSRVIVYDHGCLKRIPPEIATGYAGLFLAAIEGRNADIPAVLKEMGVHGRRGEPIEQEICDPYVELFSEIVRESPPYRFGENEQMYARIMELGAANWSKSTQLAFPEHIIFIDRSFAGHFGNLINLGAEGPWRDLVIAYAGS